MVNGFFQSHAGNGLVGISAAALLLAWPPALPWIAAAALLQFGVRHLVLAFNEVERETQAPTGFPALDAPDCQRRTLGARHNAVPARSQVE